MQCDARFCACATRRGETIASALVHNQESFGASEPYWSYEDIGIFFLVLVLLGFVLRLFVRFHLLPRSQVTNPSGPLQFVVVVSLSLGLHLVLRLRHHQPVLRPLGWVWPRRPYFVVALLGGLFLGAGVALYLTFRSQSQPHLGVFELLVLSFVLGPVLEESLFRACLLPLLAQTTGSGIAVILTAIGDSRKTLRHVRPPHLHRFKTPAASFISKQVF